MEDENLSQEPDKPTPPPPLPPPPPPPDNEFLKEGEEERTVKK